MEDEELYKETILELYRNPHNKKIVEDFNAYQKENNPLCGDEIELFLKFDSDDKLIDIGFQGEGCAISQAGVSLITEYVKNKTKVELQKITADHILVLLGLKNLNPTRLRCALLGLKTLGLR